MSINARDKLQDLIDDFRDAMLVTSDPGGTLQARPMHVADHDEAAGTLVFASSVESGKVAEIRADADACVTFQGGGKYVSLSGNCAISQDRTRIEGLWNKAWELWFPEGPQQADICLIVFTPTLGEYWDNSGAQGLKYLWKAATAMARDKSPDLSDDKDIHAETTL